MCNFVPESIECKDDAIPELLQNENNDLGEDIPDHTDTENALPLTQFRLNNIRDQLNHHENFQNHREERSDNRRNEANESNESHDIDNNYSHSRRPQSRTSHRRRGRRLQRDLRKLKKALKRSLRASKRIQRTLSRMDID
ncbi:uncharacterized protein LOC142236866 [Haematobia irritans]|uniref:uncharacterized protein LOC142236866 n=1 Tax=Haematobia irritans TaxID=7368 RepID=UPI003F5080A1